MADKRDIRQTGLADLETFFLEAGDKKFRARQVWEWIWKKSAVSFDEMTSLSLEVRRMLDRHFEWHPAIPEITQQSSDGTVKAGFRLHDGHLVEGVLIPARDRMTACVSSQVGCSLTCTFCATGAMKRMRNLEPGEIYDQVVWLRRQAEEKLGHPLSNIVFMGMGEPLLNYRHVTTAIDHITSPQGLEMAPRRVTLSTAGVARMIMKLADDGVKCNLALSLHAADDEKRNAIMPINEQNNLEALAAALQYYHRKTRRGLTFEYILFAGFNDSRADARNLMNFAHKVPCKVNLIEYNPVDGVSFEKSSPEATLAFSDLLRSRGMQVNLRKSRGKDIDAACGQLANKPNVA